jgi:glycosyltransferase involved in cell wall biosynthesis
VTAGSTRRRVTLITTEPLGPRLAGPAIRAVELGAVLSAFHDVSVVTTASCAGAPPPVLAGGRWLSASDAELPALAATEDVIVVGGDVLARNRSLAAGRAAVVVDLYDPFQLEQLEQARDLGDDGRRAQVFGSVDVLNVQAALGDLFLCASGRQRDFWLGQLSAAGRLNPVSYDADPSFASLLRVVPFGVPSTPPPLGEPVLRGVVPGIFADDDVLLWGGGIYNWFDPATLIEAVDVLRVERPSLKLVFLGAQHPNPAVARMRSAVAARSLSDSRGLTGVHVFFSDTFSTGWIPYAERGRYLSEATIGVSTHHDHVETAYSFRTRILDYLWAGLPVVTTGGDELSALVASSGAGRVTDAGDVGGLVDALRSLLTDAGALAAAGTASAALGAQFRWSSVAQPLVDFCAAPHRAPDLADPATRLQILSRLPGVAPVRLADRWSALRKRIASDGLTAAAAHVVRRLRARFLP